MNLLLLLPVVVCSTPNRFKALIIIIPLITRIIIGM